MYEMFHDLTDIAYLPMPYSSDLQRKSTLNFQQPLCHISVYSKYTSQELYLNGTNYQMGLLVLAVYILQRGMTTFI